MIIETLAQHFSLFLFTSLTCLLSLVIQGSKIKLCINCPDRHMLCSTDIYNLQLGMDIHLFCTFLLNSFLNVLGILVPQT